MKTCPVCKANCFDDMDVCFGCLHDFSRQDRMALRHAKASVLESSLEDDWEPEEAVAPIRSQIGKPVAPERASDASQVMVAPGVHLDVPAGFRLVLKFEPSG